jgi:hypothetical protein
MANEFLAGHNMEVGKPADGDYRTWSDRTGKFDIKAKFLRASGRNVSLERYDGKVIEVPLEKLSDADRQFVERQSLAF